MLTTFAPAVSGRSIVLGHRSRGIMRSLIAKRSAQHTVLMRRIAFFDPQGAAKTPHPREEPKKRKGNPSFFCFILQTNVTLQRGKAYFATIHILK